MARHRCPCWRPLVTDSPPDGLDACSRCRGAVSDDAAERLPDLEVPYGTRADPLAFNRWANEALRQLRP
jgi:hypothetical protein